MADIESLFPPNPDMTEEDIDSILSRVDYAARLAVGGALAASVSVAGLKLWRHFHPYSGIDYGDS